ncbi:type 2C protein phosphatase PTC7 KNAG_0B04530 [Huiozyma naganishii CBS 8797]|uniref:Protein phosphatase n=1 Tax=Huiozyma naganishii (strain ATCC MYA-139 / BCRC 22969 / CBS 8797 / KCTC 17520 / NBRC 10181 / NCYC 3082 / Yp74L-3) TaxID=1071383 RepID=J7RVE0_HUIN7|nr:hypothetical protein KNAG_0B04530 [Kazachstania naganishii CBS 8797]CCK68887.1 hypothetical protein KNAG_0B04530 [Kazachstania naganishii CBS 8797]
MARLLIHPSFDDLSPVNNGFLLLKSQLGLISRRYFVSDSTHSNYQQYQGSGQQSSNANTGDISGPFSYKFAVAYQPKDRDDKIYQKLKDSLMSATGEDNFFVTSNSVSDLWTGVADGVGGWVEHGYDSSAISRELCKAMGQLASLPSPKGGKDQSLTPKDLIGSAYRKIKDEKTVEVGGTTAIAAHFENNGTLNIANLGDSWCGVFRDHKMVFQTKFQTVGFNAPFQLAIIPEPMAKEAARTGRSYIQNTPEDADEYKFDLAKNDVVILATDGVTDNIDTGDIELFLRDNEAQVETDFQNAAKELVAKIVTISKDPKFPSVFSQELTKLTGKLYQGGKEDDITMVMVHVK